MRNTTLRVWVGCLACYNDGVLAGQWFDAIDCPTAMTGEGDESWHGRIDERQVGVSKWHYRDGHDELHCFDEENFGRLLRSGECGPVEAKRIAELVDDLDDNDLEAIGLFYANDSTYVLDEDFLQLFRDSYRGCHERERDWAKEDAEETHGEALKALPEDICYAIDWQVVWDNMPNHWSERARGGGVHIFESH